MTCHPLLPNQVQELQAEASQLRHRVAELEGQVAAGQKASKEAKDQVRITHVPAETNFRNVHLMAVNFGSGYGLTLAYWSAAHMASYEGRPLRRPIAPIHPAN